MGERSSTLNFATCVRMRGSIYWFASTRAPLISDIAAERVYFEVRKTSSAESGRAGQAYDIHHLIHLPLTVTRVADTQAWHAK